MKTKFNGKIIDAHVHLLRGIEKHNELLHIMDELGIKSANIACLPPFKGIGPSNYQALDWKKKFPEKFHVFGCLEYLTGSGKKRKDFLSQVKNLHKLGVDGIKMIEGKPYFRKNIGLSLDSPLYDNFYSYIEAKRLPLLIHVADPDSFWDEKRIPAFAIKEGWGYLDGSFPPYEQFYSESENALKKHPGLRIVFAHFYFLSGDMKRAAAFLDRWPNVSFDITPGVEMFHNFSREHLAWRKFFIKYQDRIIFGSDNDPDIGQVGIDLLTEIREFLETSDKVFSGRGLALGDSVLEKIYFRNFLKLCSSKKPYAK